MTPQEIEREFVELKRQLEAKVDEFVAEMGGNPLAVKLAMFEGAQVAADHFIKVLERKG